MGGGRRGGPHVCDRRIIRAPYGPYDYLIPEGLRARVEPGKRVRVPLGQGNRTVVAYCVKTRVPGADDDAAAVKRHWKEIKSVVDAQPLLTPAMLRLTEWMSDYYLCPWGQVLEAVVPTGVRIQAGTRKVALLSVPAEVTARMAELKLPPRQAEILRSLAASAEPVPLPDLLSRMKCTTSPIRELERKGLVESEAGRVYHGCRRNRSSPARIGCSSMRTSSKRCRPSLRRSTAGGSRHCSCTV